MSAWTKRTRAPSRSAASRCASTACSTIVQQRLVVEPATSAQSASGTSCPITAAIASGCRVVLAEPRHAPVDHLPQECRHHDAVELAERPAVVVSSEKRFLLQRAQELGGEERVALGVLIQIADEARLRPGAGRR